MKPLARVLFACALALLLGLSLAGCSRPKPPALVPKEAKLVALGPDGITLQVLVEMTNPNGFTVAVQRVSGRVRLGDAGDVGEVVVPQAVTLPPGVPTPVQVPLTIRWAGAAVLVAAAAQGADLPYTVAGTVGVGGERLSVEVPYELSGVITRQQLEEAAMRSLRNVPLPPGLGGPLAPPAGGSPTPIAPRP